MRLWGLVILITAALNAPGQSITGTWQVVKESTCLGDDLDAPSETEAELKNRMATHSGQTPKVIQFNSDNTGEQNWKSVGKKKASVKEKFLYKTTDGELYLLDKNSRLITDSYQIRLLTADSCVLVNKSRPCERMELVRVNQP